MVRLIFTKFENVHRKDPKTDVLRVLNLPQWQEPINFCQWFKATRIKVRLQAVSLFLNANVEQRSRKTRETRAAAARAIFVPHVFSLDGLRNDFQCRVNFYVRTCVKFTFANKIDAMHER